jgi:hypothetical protein
MLGKCISTCIFFPGRFFKFHQTKQQRQMPPHSCQRNTAQETPPAPEDPVWDTCTCAAGRNARAATSDIPLQLTAARTSSSGDQACGFARLSGTIFHSWFLSFAHVKKGNLGDQQGRSKGVPDPVVNPGLCSSPDFLYSTDFSPSPYRSKINSSASMLLRIALTTITNPL